MRRMAPMILIGCLPILSGCAIHGKHSWLRFWGDYNSYQAYSVTFEEMSHQNYRASEVAHYNWQYNHDPGPKPKYRELYPEATMIATEGSVVGTIGPSQVVYPEGGIETDNTPPLAQPPADQVYESSPVRPDRPQVEDLPPLPEPTPEARQTSMRVQRLSGVTTQVAKRNYAPELLRPWPPQPPTPDPNEYIRPTTSWLFSTLPDDE